MAALRVRDALPALARVVREVLLDARDVLRVAELLRLRELLLERGLHIRSAPVDRPALARLDHAALAVVDALLPLGQVVRPVALDARRVLRIAELLRLRELRLKRRSDRIRALRR